MDQQKKNENDCDYILSLENPSPQTHKLKISYIINEPNAPTKKFGGIFKHTAVDKETGIQYYNFLETEHFIEYNKMNCTIIIPQDKNKKKRLSVKLHYDKLYLMNEESKKLILNKILLRKISW